MKIEVQFPLVMKWQHTLQIEVSDPPKFVDVQKAVYAGFWNTHRSYIETLAKNAKVSMKEHGSYTNVRLQYVSDDVETILKDDSELQAYLKTCTRIQAIFDVSHSTGKDEAKKA